MDPISALRIFGGAARWPRLRDAGVSRRSLPAAVTGGRVLAVGHGGYALPDADAALIAAVQLCGLASHASAARLHGLALWEPIDGIDVTVRPGSHPDAPPGVRVHRALVRPDEVDFKLPMTNVLRTALDCGRTLPFPDAVVILDSALHNGRVKLATLQAAAASARGPGAGALRRAVAHVDALCGSPLESALRLLLLQLGVRVETQVRFPGLTPVDFVLDGWLVVEADGFEFHHNRTHYRNDRERGNRLVELGRPVLRYTWEDVKFQPRWVLAQVRAVLALGPSAHDQSRNS